MVTFSWRRNCLIITIAAVFSQTLSAAIYRATDVGALVNSIVAANNSAEDDIIDMEGFALLYETSCATGVFDNPNCTLENALPPVHSASVAGTLSIINGRIDRAGDATANYRILRVNENAQLTLFNVKMNNGYIAGLATGSNNGGAILNDGTLDIENCSISGSYADDNGGGIYNSAVGTLMINNSQITANIANDTVGGVGGGGGIYNAGSITNIQASEISQNLTLGYGAGINNQGNLQPIFMTTIADNACCSTIVDYACSNTPPTGTGGGIYNSANATALQLITSTISGNSAYQGGGLYNDCTAQPIATSRDNFSPLFEPPFGTLNTTLITASTFTLNSAYAGGGGIFNNNNVSGQVAYIQSITSTIVAGNSDSSSTPTPDIQNFDDNGPSATIVETGYDLIGDDSGCDVAFFPPLNIVGTSTNPINPLLFSLSFNGGFTRTHALMPGSAAKDTGAQAFYATEFDQRGSPYLRVVCATPDIGAFESAVCAQ